VSTFAWSLLHAVEAHAVIALLLVGSHPVRPSGDPVIPERVVTIDDDLPPLAPAIAKDEALTRATVPSPFVGRPGESHPHRGSPPATAASAIALPDVGALLPVGTASAYPGD
jgi:hypothetical protein